MAATAPPIPAPTMISTVSDDSSPIAPLIAHVILNLDIGGMENGIVNLINTMPAERYRHVVICLKGYSDFRRRIHRDDVAIHALDRREGKSLDAHIRLWRLLRTLKPAIVHTRNLPTIDMVVPAALAGVPCRIHGEHGRDVLEVAGGNLKYNLMRRLLSPLVDGYIAVSRDLEGWLKEDVGVPARKVAQIYNGVDTARFRPARPHREPLPPPGFADGKEIVIGTVGRMETVKDQTTLALAFAELLKIARPKRPPRLVMIGEGGLRARAATLLGEAGAADLAWLPGARDDIPRILRGLDVFVLPSIAEGISNTILEAMASGLPVVATAVGGNPELVVDRRTGRLVPPSAPRPMAEALNEYLIDPGLIRVQGDAGRARIERRFSLEAMVEGYLAVYDRVLAAKRPRLVARAGR